MPSIPFENGSSQGVPPLAPSSLPAIVPGLAALISPPAHCPGCLARDGLPWPDGATTRHCPRCLARLQRQARLRLRTTPTRA
jgi:hypothetical protein